MKYDETCTGNDLLKWKFQNVLLTSEADFHKTDCLVFRICINNYMDSFKLDVINHLYH